MKASTPIVSLAAAALLSASTAFGQGAAAAASAPVKVQPPAAVRDKATAPKPPASATPSKSIGKGKTSANTANTPDDTDSMWVEKIDVDGDGNVDEASLLWDDEDKVLYLYKEGTFTCSNGGTGSGGMLVAIYGKDNTHKAPVGSGWWAAELDKSECAAQAAGVYGCRFDATGKATACGMATVDDRTDALVIATVSK